MKLKLPKDYYGLGYSLYKKHTVDLSPGLTVLVGCNGAGKTTFLRMLNDILGNRKDVLLISHSNLYDGGEMAKEKALHGNKMDVLARLAFGSEGEAMAESLGMLAGDIGAKIKRSDAKEVFLLLDAMDSGYSIDNVVEMKNFFAFVLRHNADRNVYFILPANAYELARGENCLDVQEMKYRRFESYEDFRAFILQSRSKRDALAGISQEGANQ